MPDRPQTPSIVPFPEPGSQPKLLDRVRNAVRARHYSRRTENTYVHWIRRFIVFHHTKHPSTMGAPEIGAFLSWLATARRVSASTQNQALSALLFLYRHVLRIEIGAIEQVPRAKMPHRVPVVLSVEEVGNILPHLHGTMWLIGALQAVRPIDWRSSHGDQRNGTQASGLASSRGQPSQVHGAVPVPNRFRSRQLPPSGPQPFSRVRCGRLRLNVRLRANHIRTGAIKPRLSASFFRHIAARVDTTDSSVRRKWGAAIADPPHRGSAAYQVYTTVVRTHCDEVPFPALAATGRSYHTRPAANQEEEARQKRIGCLISGHFGARLPGSRPRWP